MHVLLQRGVLWFASITGLNINPLSDKPLHCFKCLIAIIWAEPNSALVGIGRLPATLIARLAFGEMRSGALTMCVPVDIITLRHLGRFPLLANQQ